MVSNITGSRSMKVTCPECGYTIFVIGGQWTPPDQFVTQCKHPREKRTPMKERTEDADCPYLTRWPGGIGGASVLCS
jgi:hypothetical protein